MNMTIEKAKQQKVFEELKVKGDCWHKADIKKDTWHNRPCTCGDILSGNWERRSHISESNPDLTTEAGAFWLMIRLEKWNRKEEFVSWLEAWIINNINIKEDYFTLDTLTWLTKDAKDGKSPAIYNAIAEFLDLEVEA